MPENSYATWFDRTCRRADELGQPLSMSQAKGIAKRMQSIADTSLLSGDDLRTLDRMVISHSDPTGEAAVRNVMAVSA